MKNPKSGEKFCTKWTKKFGLISEFFGVVRVLGVLDDVPLLGHADVAEDGSEGGAERLDSAVDEAGPNLK